MFAIGIKFGRIPTASYEDGLYIWRASTDKFAMIMYAWWVVLPRIRSQAWSSAYPSQIP